VDPWTAVVTLAVAAIALLPRAAALTPDGRATARLKRDADLWATMPDCAAKQSLALHIAAKTDELLTNRGRDRSVELLWVSSWTALPVMVVLSTILDGMTPEPGWPSDVYGIARDAIVWIALCAVLVVAVLSTASGVRIVRWFMRRRRRSRSPGSEGYSI
jgi:Flp pilus assembly protein TadB